MNLSPVRLRSPRAWLVILAAAALNGCSAFDSPTVPSAAQVSGVWTGYSTATSTSGGECLAAFFHNAIGATERASLTIAQSDSSLKATLTYLESDTSCHYSGSVGRDSLTLDLVSCQVLGVTGLLCQSGALRDARIGSSRITATVSGNRLTGALVESIDVFAVGTMNSLDPITWTESLVLNR